MFTFKKLDPMQNSDEHTVAIAVYNIRSTEFSMSAKQGNKQTLLATLDRLHEKCRENMKKGSNFLEGQLGESDKRIASPAPTSLAAKNQDFRSLQTQTILAKVLKLEMQNRLTLENKKSEHWIPVKVVLEPYDVSKAKKKPEQV